MFCESGGMKRHRLGKNLDSCKQRAEPLGGNVCMRGQMESDGLLDCAASNYGKMTPKYQLSQLG